MTGHRLVETDDVREVFAKSCVDCYTERRRKSTRQHEVSKRETFAYEESLCCEVLVEDLQGADLGLDIGGVDLIGQSLHVHFKTYRATYSFVIRVDAFKQDVDHS